MTLDQANLPTLTLDSLGTGLDGAFSGLIRWRGADVTLLRTIFTSLVEIEIAGFPVDPQSALEICVGLSFFDAMQDIGGAGLNTTIATGTGPLDDADNSRWHARCCVVIPIGAAAQMSAGLGAVLPTLPSKNSPDGGYVWIVGNAEGEQRWHWYCTWDSKAKRRQQGSETEWLQLAIQARVSTTPAIGDDINISINQFAGRMVRTMGATVELP
ncbi:hypothetical protein [Gilliamella sp. CG16]|uniref:hypothetical protein n=1 Tax=Gilliamella sp. CG16 TaxID=3351503 RepID=UPI003987C681